MSGRAARARVALPTGAARVVLSALVALAGGCHGSKAPVADAASGPAAAPVSRAPAHAFTLALTGSGLGEVATCGCSNHRYGGLDRRATLLHRLAAKGPVLALDAGDSLYRHLELPAGELGTEALTRADAILGALGVLHYAGLAVGTRDLEGGVPRLKQAAAKAKVPLLAANLVDPGGRPVFAPSRVVTVGGARVGIVGLSSADLDAKDATALLRARLTATSPADAAKRAVAALPPGVDLVVILGRLTPREGRKVAEAVPRARLVLIGGNGRLTPEGEAVGHALMYEGGGRGEVVLTLKVHLTGAGDLVDLKSEAQARAHLEALQKRLAQVQAADAGDASLVASELAGAKQQTARLRQRLAEPHGGTVDPAPVMLGKLIAPDPKMTARLAKVPRLPEGPGEGSAAETTSPAP